MRKISENPIPRRSSFKAKGKEMNFPPDDRDPSEPQARKDTEQQQDMYEREKRLRNILKELHALAVAYPSDHKTAVAEDIDFIAICCGIADYRKPKL